MEAKSETNKQISSFLFILWAGGRHYCHTHWYMPCANLLQLPPLTEWISSMDYKVATTIMQIFGYLISKFFAIKIVSELKREDRLKFMVCSVALAELALVFFGLLPNPLMCFAPILQRTGIGMHVGSHLQFHRRTQSYRYIGQLAGG